MQRNDKILKSNINIFVVGLPVFLISLPTSYIKIGLFFCVFLLICILLIRHNKYIDLFEKKITWKDSSRMILFTGCVDLVFAILFFTDGYRLVR